MSEQGTIRRWTTLAIGPALVLAALSLERAHAQGRYDGPHGPPRDFYGPGGPPPRPELPTELTAKRGYLFIDGEYVAPPYEIRFVDDRVAVNGLTLTNLPPMRGYGGRGGGGPAPRGGDGPRGGDHPRGSDSPRGDNPRSSDSPWRFVVSDLHRDLMNDCVVMSFAEQPYLVLDSTTVYELFKSLMTQSGRAIRQVSVMERLPPDFDRQVWDDWITHFQPPDDLKDRAKYVVASFDSSERKAQATIRARRWMERLAYPLSVTGMVMSVLAIGHLLGGRPHAGRPTFGPDASPEMIRTLNWSLAFAAAFSFFDLAWTILAVNTNAIHELNPLGSQLIDNPRHLAGFKISVTFSCLALLWLLRKQKQAQIAAWWVCLILTLITCRWLMMHSLYISA